jgi:hypothetical protein
MKKIVFLIALCHALFIHPLIAQQRNTFTQDAAKLRGSRFIPYPNFSGSPFLNDKFLLGELELSDGTKIEGIGLNYGTYRDELVYYNPDISSQIVLDKSSLNGFSFIDKTGKKRIFRRMFFTGYFKGDCFFEVLSEGKLSLLSFRKVSLEACDAYYSKSGMSYQPSFVYYVYSPDQLFTQINPTRNSLLSKYDKPNQKLVRKLLRKNGIIIEDEPSFVKAWDLIQEKNIPINLKSQ